jgi:6-phosphogluconate dehydrogenase
MKIGMVGLGKMGFGITQRLIDAGHEVVGFDLSHEHAHEAQKYGATIVKELGQMPEQVSIMWLMVPPGSAVDEVINQLLCHLKPNDIIIDGGNSNFHDSIRRANMLAERNIFFLDCGTSGGLLGREIGYCLMVGGDEATYTKVHEALAAIAAPGGLAYIGRSGTGHYVKMVHNGIEYALLEAYAEGFQLIKEGGFAHDELDLEKITRIWNESSVIRSWLLELSHNVFMTDQELKNISGEIAEGGTGCWTVEEAHKYKVPVPTIEKSLEVREWSRQTGGNYATKVIAMLREQFGGHAVKKVKR